MSAVRSVYGKKSFALPPLGLEVSSSSRAIKHAGRQEAQQLEILFDRAENSLEVRQNHARQLVYQEAAARAQNRVGAPHDFVAQLVRHRLEGNAGDHVVGLGQAKVGQHGANFGRGPFDQVQTWIVKVSFEKFAKLWIDLQGEQLCIGPHSLQKLACESA